MTTYPQTSDPVNALTRAGGTTELHSVDHGRVIGIWENVKHHGATGDGTTDDTTAIQTAIDALSASGGTLFFPQGTYKITSALTLPITPSSPASFTRWNIRGYGATLKATTAITMMKTSTPTSNSNAGSLTNRQYDIRGLSFLGNGTSGQKALQLLATYGSTVDSCTFNDLDSGIDCIFAISTRINNCFFVTNVTNDITIRSATYGTGAPIWSDASNDFTASNNSVVSNYHTTHSTAQATGIDVGGTGQCVIEDSVFEGLVPTISIRYDSTGSPNARSFTVRNCWFESAGAATYTCISLPAITQSVNLEHIRFLAANSTKHIDVTGANGFVIMRDCEFVAADPLIKQTIANSPQWLVYNNSPRDLLTNAAYWSSSQPSLFTEFEHNSGALITASKIRLVSTGDSVYVTSDGAASYTGMQVGTLYAHTGIRVDGTSAATGPVGTVVKKLFLQTTAGVSLGWVPIYDTIT